MTAETCMTCDNSSDEIGGETIEESDETRAYGIPTGFICDECLEESAEEAKEYPSIPLNLSGCPSAEQAAKELHNFLIELHPDYESEISLYSPKEAEKRYSGTAAWTVVWEGGSPSEWGLNLTSGWPMSYKEFPESSSGSPEVVGLVDNPNWEVQNHYSFDIEFHEK